MSEPIKWHIHSLDHLLVWVGPGIVALVDTGKTFRCDTGSWKVHLGTENNWIKYLRSGGPSTVTSGKRAALAYILDWTTGQINRLNERLLDLNKIRDAIKETVTDGSHQKTEAASQ